MALKVLMMGGRRCGKTAALSSMFDVMVNGVVNNYFAVSDDTVLAIKDGECQDSLNGKKQELTDFLGKHHYKTFLVDENPTRHFWDYTLKLQIPGRQEVMNLLFRDCPGEYFEAGGKYHKETSRFVSECDVFVIAIDTPYLMGAVDNACNNLCTDGVSSVTNRIQDITGFLNNINDHNGQDAKMVIFVPIKCEKWFHAGRIAEVGNRVKDVYSTAIKHLCKYEKVTIAIIPILTAGNILFSEFKVAKTVTNAGVTKKCCMIGTGIIRLGDGNLRQINENDTINDDMDAALQGTRLVRPSAWYSLNDNDFSYSPKNCEQLPLHILRFMLNKVEDVDKERITTHNGGFFNFLQTLWNRMRIVFGGIPKVRMKNTLARMRENNIIRDNLDGIEYIDKDRWLREAEQYHNANI